MVLGKIRHLSLSLFLIREMGMILLATLWSRENEMN